MQVYKCDICGGDWEYPNFIKLCGFCNIFKGEGISDFEVLRKRIEMHYNILFQSDFEICSKIMATDVKKNLKEDYDRMIQIYDDI